MISSWQHPGFLARALDTLFSGHCRFCSAPATGDGLCSGCHEDLPWITASCRRCGLPLASGAPVCAACLSHPPPFDHTVALWRYEAGVETLIRRFKLHGDLAAGRLLTRLAARELGTRQTPCPGPLVAMPMHPRRRRRRGFNQSALIASWLGPVVRKPLVIRHRDTPPQRQLDAEGRCHNLKGAFRLCRRPPAAVTLVDDVMTTGASLTELAHCLRAGGCRRIDVVVLARAL